MPTGYTAKLMEKGMDFKEFSFLCARAFGACIEMRDDPMDAPIPEKFEPSTYHLDAIATAKEEITLLENMDIEQQRVLGAMKIGAKLDCYVRGLEKDRVENDRLEAMRREVEAWQPPSPDHEEMKKFMLDQIRISKHDLAYTERSIAGIKAEDPSAFVPARLEELKDSISYHQKEHAEEVERASGRTRWVKQLRDSVNNLQTV